jgi:hypothetical protein
MNIATVGLDLTNEVFQVHHEPESAGSSEMVLTAGAGVVLKARKLCSHLLKAPDRHFRRFRGVPHLYPDQSAARRVRFRPDLRRMLIRYIRHYNQLPWTVKSTSCWPIALHQYRISWDRPVVQWPRL